MSLLSATQGRPERVRSLIELLGASPAPLPREEVALWLMPEPFRDPGNPRKIKAVDQVLDAARSLRLIDGTDPLALASAAPSGTGLADYVHGLLVKDPSKADGVMLDAYAFFVIQCERQQGAAWIAESTNTTIAALVDEALRSGEPEGDDRLFNDTKYPAWRAWMVYLGLGWEAQTLPSFYPHPTARLERELAGLRTGEELPAAPFLATLAERMPYLDGGARFLAMAEKVRWTPPAHHVSRVLSAALRELHDEGRLVLHQMGDISGGAVRLAIRPGHPITHFRAVTIKDGSLA